MSRSVLVIVAVAMVVAANRASGQTSSSPSSFTARDGTVDLAVPESPAFAALGLTPEQVTRPTSARELATSLVNGLDRNGRLQTGVAIDAAPYLLLAGSQLTLQKYQDPSQAITRFLARWQMSIAASKGGTESDPSVKVAVGTRFTFLDLGDPRTDGVLLTCLAREAGKALKTAPAISPLLSPEEQAVELRRRETFVRAAGGPCREESARRRWNRTAWIAGLAPTWASADGTAANLGYTGTAIWTSFGYGFEGVSVLEQHAMLAFLVRRRTGEVVAEKAAPGSVIEQDNVGAGARLILGAPTTQFNAEALWIGNDRDDGQNDRYWNVGVGLEQRLSDNVWLSIALGRQVARADGANTLQVTSAFNWGLGPRK